MELLTSLALALALLGVCCPGGSQQVAMQPFQPHMVVFNCGPHSLHFQVVLPCLQEFCPNTLHWYYKREVDTDWKYIPLETVIRDRFWYSTIVLHSLNASTKYLYAATAEEKAEKGYRLWYSNYASTPIFKLNTCPEEVPPVKGLMISSMGNNWVTLSWIPTKLECQTKLIYKFTIHSSEERTVELLKNGSYWSNSLEFLSDADQGFCLTGHDRYCITILDNVHLTINRIYIVKAVMIRSLDNKTSKKVSITFKFVGKTMAPDQPLELYCVSAEPTALTLRWFCPLRYGDTLRSAHVLVRNCPDGALLRNFTKSITLRPLYAERVDGLQPDSLYNVSVWLETKAGISGAPASLLVWTAPEGGASEAPCRCGREPRSLRSLTPWDSSSAGVDCGLGAGGGGGGGRASGVSSAAWWAWLVGALFIFLLSILLFMSWPWLIKLMRQSSKSSVCKPIVHKKLQEGFCSRVWFEGEEVFMEGMETPPRDSFSDHEYESNKSLVYSRSLVARRMLPSDTSTSLPRGSTPGAEGSSPPPAAAAAAAAGVLPRPPSIELAATSTEVHKGVAS